MLCFFCCHLWTFVLCIEDGKEHTLPSTQGVPSFPYDCINYEPEHQTIIYTYSSFYQFIIIIVIKHTYLFLNLVIILSFHTPAELLHRLLPMMYGLEAVRSTAQCPSALLYPGQSRSSVPLAVEVSKYQLASILPYVPTRQLDLQHD